MEERVHECECDKGTVMPLHNRWSNVECLLAEGRGWAAGEAVSRMDEGASVWSSGSLSGEVCVYLYIYIFPLCLAQEQTGAFCIIFVSFMSLFNIIGHDWPGNLFRRLSLVRIGDFNSSTCEWASTDLTMRIDGTFKESWNSNLFNWKRNQRKGRATAFGSSQSLPPQAKGYSFKASSIDVESKATWKLNSFQ